eukprot:GHVQ01013813.1.p1 GENE.GHVQ01013813.1~~GHVQ01013813.1.p1  ORF type:complete len:1062 (-),score=250.80 GHVQ01013813.1:1269-4454(-)
MPSLSPSRHENQGAAEPTVTRGMEGSAMVVDSSWKQTGVVSMSGSTKTRAVEAWLDSAMSSNRAGYGVDVNSLEKQGVSKKSIQRLYRGMFVYSRGMHSLIQEVIGQSDNKEQLTYTIWNVFMILFEKYKLFGQQSIQDSSMSAAKQQLAETTEQYEQTLAGLQREKENLHQSLQTLQEQAAAAVASEDETREELAVLHSNSAVALQQYELEIRRRMASEVSLHEMTRWWEVSQAELKSCKADNTELLDRLALWQQESETSYAQAREMTVRVTQLERQVDGYRGEALEWVQTKDRNERTTQALKIEQHNLKVNVSSQKTQIDTIEDKNRKLQEDNSNLSRDLRQRTSQLEDVRESRTTIKEELMTLRKRLEDSEIARISAETTIRQETEKTSSMASQFNSNQLRLTQITKELEVEKERADMKDTGLQQTQAALTILETRHISLNADLETNEEQLRVETALRKQLQLSKAVYTRQVAQLSTEKESMEQALTGAKQELSNCCKSTARAEHMLKAAKRNIEILETEKSSDQTTYHRRVTALEDILTQEKSNRASVAKEIKEALQQRVAALEESRHCNEELRKTQSELEQNRMDLDRLNCLVEAEKNRNIELQEVLDKYHSTVVGHNKEARSLQIMIEMDKERHAAELQRFADCQHIKHNKWRVSLEQLQMRFEDVSSFLNCGTLIDNLKAAQIELKQQTARMTAIEKHKSTTEENLKEQLNKKDKLIARLKTEKAALDDDYNAAVTARHVAETREREAQIEADKAKTPLEQVTKGLSELRQVYEDDVAAFMAALPPTVDKSDKATQAASSCIPEDQPTPGKKGGRGEGSCAMVVAMVQTDLSYQWLESKPPIDSPIRTARLRDIHRAARFVEENRNTQQQTTAILSDINAEDQEQIQPQQQRFGTPTNKTNITTIGTTTSSVSGDFTLTYRNVKFPVIPVASYSKLRPPSCSFSSSSPSPPIRDSLTPSRHIAHITPSVQLRCHILKLCLLVSISSCVTAAAAATLSACVAENDGTATRPMICQSCCETAADRTSADMMYPGGAAAALLVNRSTISHCNEFRLD